MNVFQSQLRRQWPITSLLILLLATSVAFMSVCFSSWYGAEQQLLTIDEKYTTTAISGQKLYEISSPVASIDSQTGNIILEDGSILYNTVRAYLSASKLPQVRFIDRRDYLGAYIPGTKALTSSMDDPLRYLWAADSFRANFCVVAAKCTAIPTSATPSVTHYSDEGNLKMLLIDDHYEFELVEAVSLMDCYDTSQEPLSFKVWWNVFTPEGEMPFEVGKTYLLRGFYVQPEVHMYSLPENDDDPVQGSTILGIPTLLYMNPYYDANLHHLSPNTGELTINEAVACPQFITTCIQEDDYYYQAEPEGQLPHYTEYTGDVNAFLASPEGKVWVDEIIPLVEMNHASATVIRTDRAESLYAFSSGDAYLLEGRMITGEEYEEGAQVCLISATYARTNGFSVGDTLEMELYDTKEQYITTGVSVGTKSLTYTVPVHYPLTQETSLGPATGYEIVGIYAGRGFNYEYCNLNPDTILIPKASVVLDEEASFPKEQMYTIILENGSAEAFEAELEALGYGGYYEYYDQGYAEALVALNATKENALRLLLAGIGILLLDAVLFFFLLRNRLRMSIRSLRLLGQKCNSIRGQLLSSVAVLVVLAVAIGVALGAVLFGSVSDLLFSQSLNLNIGALILCAGVQSALLLLVGYIWTQKATCIDLMQRRR